MNSEQLSKAAETILKQVDERSGETMGTQHTPPPPAKTHYQTPQSIVNDNIRARGYRDGWSAESFLMRQITKLAEELGEVARNVRLADDLDFGIEATGREAKDLFDKDKQDSDLFKAANYVLPCGYTSHIESISSELTDMQVVLFAAASVIEELTGRPFDIQMEAIRKSQADISRGVR